MKLGEAFLPIVEKGLRKHQVWLFLPTIEKKKGKGRGYHAPHRGRPGEVGGSLPRKGKVPPKKAVAELGGQLSVSSTSAWTAKAFKAKVMGKMLDEIKSEYVQELEVRLHGNATEINPQWPPDAIGVTVGETGGAIHLFTTRSKPLIVGNTRITQRARGVLQETLGHELGHRVDRLSGLSRSVEWQQFTDEIMKNAKRGTIPEWLEGAMPSIKQAKWNPIQARREAFAAGFSWALRMAYAEDDIGRSGFAVLRKGMR